MADVTDDEDGRKVGGGGGEAEQVAAGDVVQDETMTGSQTKGKSSDDDAKAPAEVQTGTTDVHPLESTTALSNPDVLTLSSIAPETSSASYANVTLDQPQPATTSSSQDTPDATASSLGTDASQLIVDSLGSIDSETLAAGTSNSNTDAVSNEELDLLLDGSEALGAHGDDSASSDLVIDSEAADIDAEMSASSSSSSSSDVSMRVKVYVLQEGEWQDCGTGFVHGLYDEANDRARIVVVRETPVSNGAVVEGGGGAATVEGQVEGAGETSSAGSDSGADGQAAASTVDTGEPSDPSSLGATTTPETDDDDDASTAPGGFLREGDIEEILLDSTVLQSEDAYTKQQDTLIVWTDFDGLDRALSFQDARGCDNIWDFIDQVRRMQPNGGGDDAGGGDGMGAGGQDGGATPGSGTSSSSSPLIEPSRGGFGSGGVGGNSRWPPLTLGNIREQEQLIRNSLRGPIGKERVVQLVAGEDYVRQMIAVFDQAEDLESIDDLHNLCSMMQAILSINDNTLLEYLIQDDVFMGIMGLLEYDPDYPSHKATYRAWLSDSKRFKDISLFPNESIKAKIQQTYHLLFLKDVILAKLIDDGIVPALSAAIFFNQVDIIQYVSSNDSLDPLIKAREREPFLFLHQLMLMGKNVQIQTRCRLYSMMVSKGVLSACEWAFEQPDLSNASAEMVFMALDADINGVRQHVLQGKLFDILSNTLASAKDDGLRSQAADAIRTLVEVNADGPEALPRPPRDAQLADRFCNFFYDKCIEPMYKPLANNTGDLILQRHLTDLLAQFITQHGHRAQYFILANPVGIRISKLARSEHKAVRHASLRFFRAALKSNNHFLHRHIAKQDLLDPLLDMLREEAPRDNMLSSACLEIFELIRKENYKLVINYLFAQHEDKIKSMTLIPSLRRVMTDLRTRWEQNNEPPPAESSDPVVDVVIEMNEDDYFNESDEEAQVGPPAPKGRSAGIKRKRKLNASNSSQDALTAPSAAGKGGGGGGGALGLDYEDASDEEEESPTSISPNTKRKRLSPAFVPGQEPAPTADEDAMADTTLDMDALAAKIGAKRQQDEDEEDSLSNLAARKSSNKRPGTPRVGTGKARDNEGGGGGSGIGGVFKKIRNFGGRKLSFVDGKDKKDKP